MKIKTKNSQMHYKSKDLLLSNMFHVTRGGEGQDKWCNGGSMKLSYKNTFAV